MPTQDECTDARSAADKTSSADMNVTDLTTLGSTEER